MELNECMNFLLSVAQHKVFKYYSQQLEECGVTPAQAGIISCLAKESPLTPKKIGDLLHLEASTISGILDKMQKNDLIERTTDSENRRLVLVSLTEKSKQLYPRTNQTTQEMNEQVLANLSEQEIKVLKESLKKIIDTTL